MGGPVVLALILFTFNLMRTMRAKPGPGPVAAPRARGRSERFVATLPAR
jgi:hypothetical protein